MMGKATHFSTRKEKTTAEQDLVSKDAEINGSSSKKLKTMKPVPKSMVKKQKLDTPSIDPVSNANLPEPSASPPKRQKGKAKKVVKVTK